MSAAAVRLLICTALAAVGASGSASAQNIDLVSQLDPFPGSSRYGDVWGEGDYAYLGSSQGSFGVAIIDISEPDSPLLVTTYTPASGGQFKDVKVHQGIGYFASDNGGGLHIVDVSNPASPQLLAQITSARRLLQRALEHKRCCLLRPNH